MVDATLSPSSQWLWTSSPQNLLPVFLLVLALHTFLPLPSTMALLLALIVSVAHLVAMATSAMASEGNEEDLNKKVPSSN